MCCGAFLVLGVLSLPATSAPQDPIAHWELSAEQFLDGQFQALVGAWNANPELPPKWLGSTAKGQSSAMLFEQGTPGIEVVASLESEQLPSRTLTVTAWVALDKSEDWLGVVSCFEDSGKHESGWVLGARGNRFSFGLARQDTERMTYLTASASFSTGEWAHLVGVYDGKKHQLYVDGILAAEVKSRASDIHYDPTHSLVLGAYRDSNEDSPILGALAEVRIYDKALSPSKIKKLHRLGRKRLPEIQGPTATDRTIETDRVTLRPQVNRAIAGGVDWLLQRQNRDGSWDQHTDTYRNGITALSALALLESGVPSSHPAILNAKRFLLEVPPERTYSAALQLMFFAGLKDPSLLEAAEDVTYDLLSWEKDSPRGTWGYPHGPADLSNTQFAALGLWAAQQMGVEIKPDIWNRMVQSTVTQFMAERETVEFSKVKEGRRRREIEGFTYFAHDTTYPVYGGMVVAGLGIIGLTEKSGVRLRTNLQREVEGAKARAFDWLEYHFRVDTVPGMAERLQYYLYGIERVGSLFDRQAFGPHDWYAEGATHLVATQKDDGSWHHSEYGSRHACATGFALLFLNRATAPVSYGGGGPRASAAAARVEEGPVSLLANPSQPLVAWLAGVHHPDGYLLEQEGGSGTTITQVSYLVDDVVLRTVLQGESEGVRFAARMPEVVPGPHVLIAEVLCADGTRLRSSPLQLEVTRNTEEFQRQALALRGANLLATAQPVIRVSSTAKGHTGEMACDQLQGTAWVHAQGDPSPWIAFRMVRPVKATRLILSPADAKPIDALRSASLRRVRVVVNGEEGDALELDWPSDPMAEYVVRFPRKQTLRELKIYILETSSEGTDWQDRTGFAEISLVAD